LIILEIVNVSKRYGENNVLKDISLHIETGKIYSFLGESGSGKSTLGRIISGLERPDSGYVMFNGINMRTNASKKLWRKDIALVFQDAYSSLNPRWTVSKSIQEPINNFLDLKKEERKKRVKDLIGAVGLSKDDMDKYPSELSGGQQKRVAIARAISCNPQFIIFDESISGLDIDTKNNLLYLLMQVQSHSQMTLIFITHDLEMADAISDKIIIINNGKIEEK